MSLQQPKMAAHDSHMYPPEIIGYAEPWIVSPGETVAIKVGHTAYARKAAVLCPSC